MEIKAVKKCYVETKKEVHIITGAQVKKVLYNNAQDPIDPVLSIFQLHGNTVLMNCGVHSVDDWSCAMFQIIPNDMYTAHTLWKYVQPPKHQFRSFDTKIQCDEWCQKENLLYKKTEADGRHIYVNDVSKHINFVFYYKVDKNGMASQAKHKLQYWFDTHINSLKSKYKYYVTDINDCNSRIAFVRREPDDRLFRVLDDFYVVYCPLSDSYACPNIFIYSKSSFDEVYTEWNP
jgi:hypothetical protein